MVLASTGTGDIIPNATVTVRQSGTTTNITETIYVNDDPDLSQYVNGNFQTSATGIVVFYLTNQKRVDVLFTKAGFTSVTIPVDVQKSSLVSGESVATSTIWDAAGDLAKGTGADTAARLARGTANQVLRTNAGGTDIEWGVDPAQDKITTAGDLLYGTAADTAARLGIGTAGQVLKVNAGANAPEWGAAASSAVGDLLDWQFVRKTANESVTSSTVSQDDDHLTLPIGANETWIVEYVLLVDGSTGGDIGIEIGVPTGAAGRFSGSGPAVAVTGAEGDAHFREQSAGAGNVLIWGTPGGEGADSRHSTIRLLVVCRNGATAGSITLRWAQATSNATATTLYTDSVLLARRVA